MIPILMLSILTRASDGGLANSKLIPWWTSTSVVKVLQKYAKYRDLNLANEVGFYRWADNPKTALTSYVAAYKTAIASIRRAGLTVPLMIDRLTVEPHSMPSSPAAHSSSPPTPATIFSSASTPIGQPTMASPSFPSASQPNSPSSSAK